jgi:hypothetical protein
MKEFFYFFIFRRKYSKCNYKENTSAWQEPSLSKKAHQRKCKDKGKREEQVTSTKTKIRSSLRLLLTASPLKTTTVLTFQPLLDLIIEFLLGNHDISTLGNQSHSTDTDHVLEELIASS